MSIQNRSDRFLKGVTWILFVFCMLVLTRYILFKGAIDETKVSVSRITGKKTISKGFKKANFTPFATLKLFYSVRRKYTYVAKNVLGNIIGFIPLGVLLPVLYTKLQAWRRTIGVVFLISLGFEVIQLLSDRGVFDVDDILLNSFGGAIGYFFYYISKKLMYLNDTENA